MVATQVLIFALIVYVGQQKDLIHVIHEIVKYINKFKRNKQYKNKQYNKLQQHYQRGRIFTYNGVGQIAYKGVWVLVTPLQASDKRSCFQATVLRVVMLIQYQ
ncbi:Hypothetical_protein [Hexamita inflata]|uniref:Hypothetical_protein n=1 Tax=Hexamita inflata TaxID=28002 RepID=A0AA86R9F9_9EUKA|nr:Hypothetical protein HINF_LOCUS59667 [Hexamita inflata]